MKPSALVLSGGGTLGTAHIGVLKSLATRYQFDFLCGVSAGAIVAGFLAVEFQPDQIWDIVRHTNIFPNMLDLAKNSFGLVAGDRIVELLKTHLGEVEFADLDYPLYIGATDFKTGKNVALCQGKLTDAIRASISVPVLFSPYYHPDYDQWLVDGGLSQNFPLDLAIDQYQGDQIIGIDVIGQINSDIDFSQSGPSIPPIDQISKIRPVLERSIRIMLMNQEAYFRTDQRVKIIRPPLTDYTSYDITKVESIYQIGLESGRSFIDANTRK